MDAATGVITTVAGDGTSGSSGDGGPATSASLNTPIGVAVDASGNLFIADTGNNRIRRVDAATGVITNVAGDGTSGFSGDGGPATSATLNLPHGVTVDASGNLYIADTGNDRIRKVEAVASAVPTATPTSTPTATPTANPKLNSTPAPDPTATSRATPITVLPTATPTAMPTSTPTPIPPTATPMATPVPSAAELGVVLPGPSAPPPAEESGGGACSSTFGRTPPLTGLASILLLIAPLGLVAAMRRRHQLCDGPPCRIHDQAMYSAVGRMKCPAPARCSIPMDGSP